MSTLRIGSAQLEFCSSFSAEVSGRTIMLKTCDMEVSESGEHSQAIPDLGNGRLLREEFRIDDFRLVREIFTPDESQFIAVRLRLHYTGNSDVSLDRLSPVRIGPDSLTIAGLEPSRSWRYMRQPRHKNELPSVCAFGASDEELKDAVTTISETGKGSHTVGDDRALRFLSSEITLIGSEEGAIAFLSFPIWEQLMETELLLDHATRAIHSFRADFVADGVVVRTGAPFESQWLLLMTGPDMVVLAERVATVLASKAGIRKSSTRKLFPSPPTVWCSWYYYGGGFTRGEMSQIIDSLRHDRLPIDVVQIDSCWSLRWGDWEPLPAWGDMKELADEIRGLGYEPGIWTCPFLAEPRSHLRHHHDDWLLRKRNGDYLIFPMDGLDCFVLDTTIPEVLKFIESIFRKLRLDWGYSYHKVDFTRAVADPEARYADSSKTRAQAFRAGIRAIRSGLGEEAYLDVCGGLYGPSIGLADAQRTGADVISSWPPADHPNQLSAPLTIKQNVLRFWMNTLWDNDADALMVRRRTNPYRGELLSLGTLTDAEAETSSLNQYLGGGLVTFCENLAEVDQDRMLLLSKCSPSVGKAAVPRDLEEGARFPSIYDTQVFPIASELGEWHTIAVVNWSDRELLRTIRIDRGTLGAYVEYAPRFVISDYHEGSSFLRAPDEDLELGVIAPHSFRLLRVVGVSESDLFGHPLLLWTDGHFSMGGREILKWEIVGNRLNARFDWRWNRPLRVRYLDADVLETVSTEPLRYAELTIPPHAGICERGL